MQNKYLKRILVTLWLVLPLTNTWAASENTGLEIRSMPMDSIVGSECPTTGARVDAVDTTPDTGEQRIVVSIPRGAVAQKPNIRLYRIDAQAFAFEDFKEIRDKRDPERRSFAFVVKESDQFQFKVGFDSAQ